MKHEIIKLPYKYNALEPHIDEKTMTIHHDKHHQTYCDKLNAALDKHPELFEKKVEELLGNLNSVPEEIRTAVRNHGGGLWNHNFFWNCMKAGGSQPSGKILEAINAKWGSFDKFKEEFSTSATNLFGSGWTWLVSNKGELEIVNTPNQDCPISQGKVPLLGLDVWEHGYYLRYQNKRVDYIAAWWNVVNWNEAERTFNQK